MNDRTLLVFAGGDLRTLVAARLFASEGRRVLLTGFDRYTPPEGHEETLTQFVSMPEQALSHADVVVLPMPYTKGGGVLFAPFSSSELPLEDVFRLSEHARAVCGGMLPEEDERFLDYCDEAMLLRNADVTAEGALVLAAQAMPICLNGSRVLILGFGRIGKRLAVKARALGCRVTVAARKESDHALIRMCGHEAVSFGELPSRLPEADVIFNTVPAEVLAPSALATLPEGSTVIDLANAVEGGKRVLQAPGVPGKYAPESAGRILKESVERALTRRGLLERNE